MSDAAWARRPPPPLAPDARIIGRWHPARPADVTAGRRQLAATVGDEAGSPHAGAVERLLLAFEELTSNAVRHGRAPVEATVTASDHFWLLQVRDAAGESPPAPAVGRDAALGGLGLGMVDAICGAVGWKPLEDGGKLVWALLDTARQEAPGTVPRPRDGAAESEMAAARGRRAPAEPAPLRPAGALAAQVAGSRLLTDVLTAALEALPDGVALFDGDWTIDYVNSAGAVLLGRPAAELLGRSTWVALPELGGTILHSFLLHARGAGEPVTWSGFYPPAGRWLSVSAGMLGELLQVTFRATGGPTAEPSPDERIGPPAPSGSDVDRDRLRFLAEVSESLIATLDTGESASRLAELAAGRFCDWAVVALVGEDGAPGEEAWAHCDPRRRPALDTYMCGRLRGTGDDAVLVQALLTGEPVQVPVIDQEAVAPSLPTEEVRAAWQRLDLTSCTIVPLRARGETFGALALMNAGARPLQTEMELAVAVEAARRGALALDNARLYGRQQRMAATLQQSLLTPPPRPDHLQIVVRYRPAAAYQQVGGDWYDAFAQPDGATLLVIGDVVGHNVDAAAAMGQIRSILRGIAIDRPETPAEILTRVDRVLDALHVGTLATALVARIERPAGQAAAGIRTLRWSSAGHLPPLLLHPDGGVDLLASPPERLLGTATAGIRTNHDQLLHDGDTVVFCTDGLVETGRTGIDEGLARLCAELGRLAAADLDTLCDALLDRLADGRADDDIALLAVRVHADD
jgi:serine phosphatase RsbU (regulator of sigma subunit)/PAS domain-containing protein